MKEGVVPLTIISIDLLGEFVLLDPETLSSVCLEELAFQMGSFTCRHSKVPSKWKGTTATWLFWAPSGSRPVNTEQE